MMLAMDGSMMLALDADVPLGLGRGTDGSPGALLLNTQPPVYLQRLAGQIHTRYRYSETHVVKGFLLENGNLWLKYLRNAHFSTRENVKNCVKTVNIILRLQIHIWYKIFSIRLFQLT